MLLCPDQDLFAPPPAQMAPERAPPKIARPVNALHRPLVIHRHYRVFPRSERKEDLCRDSGPQAVGAPLRAIVFSSIMIKDPRLRVGLLRAASGGLCGPAARPSTRDFRGPGLGYSPKHECRPKDFPSHCLPLRQINRRPAPMNFRFDRPDPAPGQAE